MTTPKPIDLSPVEASRRIQKELEQARNGVEAQDLDAVLDGFVHALGLALQLGPALTEQVLVAALDTAREYAKEPYPEGLSALGPVLVDLVRQVRGASALPSTPIMDAWATVTSDIGSLIGQVGLVLALAPEHRAGLIGNARSHALLLDEVTGELFALTPWIDQLQQAP
jgi:hypothetical protein